MFLQRIIVLIFVLGCNKQTRISLQDFNTQMQIVFEMSRNFKIYKKAAEKSNDSWQSLARFDHAAKSFCLFNKPFKKKKTLGELRFVEIALNETCEKSVFGERQMTMQNIRNFSISHTLQEIQIKFDYKEINDYRAKNLAANFRTPYIENNEIQLTPIGATKTQNSIESGVVCFGFDKDCVERLQDNCSRCENGFSWRISRLCAGQIEKVCGIEKCGGHNEVACLAQVKDNFKYNCSSQSNDGFCQVGKDMSCDAGILRCYD